MAMSFRRQQCLFCELRQLTSAVARPASRRTLPSTAISTSVSLRRQHHQSRNPVEYRSGQRRWKATLGYANSSPAPFESSPRSNASSTSNSSTRAVVEPDRELSSITDETRLLIASPTLPPEATVLAVLKWCRHLSHVVVEGKSTSKSLPRDENTATSALLSLQELPTSKPSSSSLAPLSDSFRKRAIDSLSSLSTQILRDPKIFITPSILQTYVSIQTVLRRPESLPEIFSLYATKPIPKPASSPITYSPANPKSQNNAIPQSIANLALEAAIARKNLPLALSVIDTTFCAPAFYRSKILRKAALPMTGLALAPLASYAVATYFAQHYQDTMDTGTATNLAFAAIVSYVSFTAIIGLVAVTTANDQMVRVTWVGGIPLRERWLREEERAALDKLAVAWGFKEEWKRGMEEGVEWESLREFIGRRGMILDASNLMQGME